MNNKRVLRGLVAAICGLAPLSCGRCNYDFVGGDNLDGGETPDANPPPRTWGEYVDSVELPGCAVGPSLIVDTADNELSGGSTITDVGQSGATLSLLEAFQIAFNLGTPHAISFDESVFPKDQRTTITIGGTPVFGAAVCIDGRGAGVEIVFAPNASSVYLASGSLLVGLSLTFSDGPMELRDSQVAGCQVSVVSRAIESHGSLIFGPHNTVSASRALRTDNGPVHVFRSFFGFDPIAQSTVPLGELFDIRGGVPVPPLDLLVEDNVIAATGSLFSINSSADHINLIFRNNQVGLEGVAGQVGVGGLEAGTFTIGPGNNIRGVGDAVSITDTSARTNVRVTQNSISGNTRGIVFTSASPVPAPIVTSFDGQANPPIVGGTCPTDGVLELYSDPGDQGEIFLVEGACDSVTPWSLEIPSAMAASLSSGRNLTATLTDPSAQTSAFSSPLQIP